MPRRWLLVSLWFVAVTLVCSTCTPTPKKPEPWPTDTMPPVLGEVEREATRVWHWPSGESEYELSGIADLFDGDRVRTNEDGSALLKFLDMWMRLYYDGGVQLAELTADHTTIVQQNGSALYGMSGEGQVKVSIDTPYAEIEALGTIFAVVYVPDSETTLVYTLEGTARMRNKPSGEEAEVWREIPANRWSTVVAGQEPSPALQVSQMNSILERLDLWDVMEKIQRDVLEGDFTPPGVSIPDQVQSLPLKEQGVTELTLAMPRLNEAERQVFGAQLDRFAQQTGVEVNLREVAEMGELYTRYMVETQAGTADFDVVTMDTSWAASLYDAGWLAPLNGYIESMGLETGDFFDGAVQAVTYKEDLLALPWRMNVPLLYYRSDLLEELGLTPPQTYDELIEVAAKATEAATLRYGYVWAGYRTGGTYEPLAHMFNEHSAAFGGQILTSEGVVAVAGQENVDALAQIVLYVESEVSPLKVPEWSENDALELFSAEAALFMRNWPYAWSLVSGEDSPLAGRVGLALLPGRVSSLTSDGLGIWVESEHSVEAAWLVAFLTDTAQQQEQAIQLDYYPTRNSVYERTPEGWGPFGDQVRVLQRASQSAVSLPLTPVYGEVSQILAEWTQLALYGEVSPEEAIEIMTEQLYEVVP